MNLPRQWAQRWFFCTGMLSVLMPGQAQQPPAGWQTQGPFAVGLAGITSPYRVRVVPPVEFANSARIDALVRAGRMYLSLQDAIALALENNLDIELQRYGPRIAQTDLERAEAGGSLRGVSTATQATSDTSAGSVTGTTTSTGTPIPSLEPALVGQLNWSHRSQPQINSFSTGANYLVSKARLTNFGFQQGFLTGTTVNFGWNNNWLDQNSARADFNPATSASFNLTVTQRLLQGFGLAINSRNIRIAKNNQQVSDLVFEQQVIATVSSVIDVYWELASLNEEVKVRRQSLALSQKLLDDNKQRVELGSLAAIEIARTEAEVARADQDLTIAETARLQQETILAKGTSPMGTDMDERVIIPLTTAMRRTFNVATFTMVRVRVSAVRDVQPVASEIRALIRERHNIRPPDLDDFRVVTPDIIAGLSQMVSGTLNRVLLAVTVLALIVGGIVLMNLMLLSVTERRHEIGLRRALGGKRRDILLQFLFESIALTSSGGLLGLALGIPAALLVGKLTAKAAEMSWEPVALALGLSLLVGLLFELLPARRAASLHPVEALR